MTVKHMSKEDLLYKLREVQRDHYMTQEETAREIGIHSSTLSAIYNGTYKADETSVLSQIEHWLTPIMDPNSIDDVVHTSTFDDMIRYFNTAYNTHVIYAVEGKSGFGKTIAAQYYSRIRMRAYWVPGRANMGAKHLLTEIAKAARIPNAQSASSVYEMQNRIMAHFAVRSALLIIDEADKLGVKTLDALREIFDLGTIGLILMGEVGLDSKLRQRDRSGLSLERLYNRIDQFFFVNSISRENVASFLKHYGFTSLPERESFESLIRSVNRIGGYRRLRKVVDQLRVITRTTEGESRSIPKGAIVEILGNFPA